MNELEELERRLASAMERIANGLGALGSDPSNDSSAISAELEDERLANAQLKERSRKLSEQLDTIRQTAAERMAALDVELQRLKKANELLRVSNAALRDANEAGVGDPHLINKAMLSELEGLRASRAADIAETATILGALETALTEAEETNHA
ncbi:MAG: hypothetical protein ABJQ34_12485 [Paracoccaceae bacterium]